jgi:hypothetical protein
VAKRGRPLGALSWARNLNNRAAHHAQVLMEVWLAEAQVLEVRIMLSSLDASPELQALIEECWGKRGHGRRFTVPPKIKRKLCRLAVAHVVELRREEIQRQQAQAAERTLRAAGYTDAQIAEILTRRTPVQIAFKTPNLETVLKILNRRAPTVTLRRKAADRKLRR